MKILKIIEFKINKIEIKTQRGYLKASIILLLDGFLAQVNNSSSIDQILTES